MQTLIDKQGREIKITWYEEARELIFALASRYENDVTKISRGGKGRNKRFYYNYCCSFDIETTTIRSGQYGYRNEAEAPLGVPYLFQWNIYGNVIMCRYIREAVQIFSWLSQAFCKGRHCLCIFDHNLGYEYGFFKDYWDLDYERCFCIDIHHPVTLALKNGLVIRDSYKMTNMSLNTLSKDWSREWFKAPEIMDYDAVRFPWTELDENTLLYSALDVLSLSDGIEQYLAARNTGAWCHIPTSTGFYRAMLKKEVGIGAKKRTKEQQEYQKWLQKVRITPDIYDILIRQARGGNTHANRLYTGILIDRACHFDITSSYPAQMVCYPEFPVGPWMQLDEGSGLEDIELLERNGYCCIFDLILIDPVLKERVPVPYLALSKCTTLKGISRYSDNGRYVEGAEMLETTIFGIEWPIIKSQYDYKDAFIIRGYFAKKGYLPDIVRRFIIELYKKKTELKGIEGQEIEYQLSKAAVNGIYGMAFTKILRNKMIIDDSGIREGDMPEPEAYLEKYQKSTSYFLPYSVGAMTATLGRVYLQKMIDAIGFDDFIYCDTDSVFARDPEKSRAKIRALEAELLAYQRRCGMELTYYDRKGRPHELGAIDEEPECSFKSFGAKKYIQVIDGELSCTVAGVPKKEGAKIIGSPDNFKLGLVFPGRETNKLCLWYNDDEGAVIRAEGHSLRVRSNIAMLPVSYVLGLSDDYRTLLQIEGINSLFSFSPNDKNVVEEVI